MTPGVSPTVPSRALLIRHDLQGADASCATPDLYRAGAGGSPDWVATARLGGPARAHISWADGRYVHVVRAWGAPHEDVGRIEALDARPTLSGAAGDQLGRGLAVWDPDGGGLELVVVGNPERGGTVTVMTPGRPSRT